MIKKNDNGLGYMCGDCGKEMTTDDSHMEYCNECLEQRKEEDKDH